MKFIKKRKKDSKINKSKTIVKQEKESIPLKKQIITMICYELMGIALCLLVLFALCGGKNFIKLYKELNKFINVYDTITSNYYGDLDKEELIDTAIDAMLNSIGDSYTTYTDEETTDNFLENIDGTYEGIGCTVAMDENDNIYIVSIFDNSPSQKAGLQKNDIILKVDGEDYTNKKSDDVATYIKNSKNNKINLTIKRGEEEKEITIERQKVEVPSVTSKVIEEQDKKIGYIDISIFSSLSYEQFKNELTKLEKKNIQGLIIDLRNNTGGYLNSVTDITNLFLKKGQIIYQLENDKSTEKIKDTTKEYRTYPIAVLINAASASASEILASAIKESYSYKYFIVGTYSYGKGTVQKTKQLSDGTMIKYTIQKWLTPNGNWINEKGVEPTNPVALDTTSGEDNQLNTAKDLIMEQIN
jgi:carboxyl-terminal processing protease